MTAKRKAAKPKRTNKNRHYRSKLTPKVQELINDLRSGWAVMGLLERGERLNKLISLGCSRRGLGRELGVSATSIRRHAEIAQLPENDRQAIAAGASAKKILSQKANSDRQSKKQQRVDQDQKTGALSDEIATMILEFCRTLKELRKFPLIDRNFPILLDRAASLIRDFEASGHRSVKVSKKFDLRELFRKTRPRAAKNTPALVHQALWLAEVLWLIAPESPVTENALLKARRRVAELTPRGTPSESRIDAHLHQRARLIELFHLPPRKFHAGGAKSMQRQGMPTQSSKRR
jgi:hypothetical protein